MPDVVDCAGPDVLCVDDTPGVNQEYATLQAAADAVQPGQTVSVFDGDYAGFTLTRGGTSSARVTFRAVAAGARITSDGPSQGTGVFLENVSYVTVDGLNIVGVSGRGIAHRGATATAPVQGLSLVNNTIENTGAEGMYLSQVADSVVSSNTIRNAGMGVATLSHGIYLANAGSDGTTLRGNVISGSGGQAVHFNGDLSIGGDGLISGLVIEANVLHDNANNALNMDGVEDSLIQNNLIYGNTNNAIRAYAIDGAAGPRGLVIVNNTIHVPVGGRWCVRITEDRGGNIVFNNILINDGTHGSIALDQTAGFASANNAVVDRFTLDRGATILTLSQWQALGYDTGSFLTTASALWPGAGSGEYQLSTPSAVVDAGLQTFSAATAPAVDIGGSPRQGAPDLGAYEYGAASSTDTEPPSVPADLVAQATAPTRVSLTWSPSTDDVGVAGYRAYRDNSLVGSTATTDFLDSTATPATTYRYEVEAYDAAGNVSNRSVPAVVTTPPGGGGAAYESTDALYDALYDAAMGPMAGATWVAQDGSDSASGTEAAPYATLGRALAAISGGGIVIVKDGTYAVGPTGWLNDHNAAGSIPSGTAAAYTIIRAQNRFGARLVQNSANYYGGTVNLEFAQYVWVDGFVIEKGSTGAEYAVDLGNNNRLTRTIVVQKTCENYGGAVAYGSNNVLEDVHAFGWGRYVFYGGAGGGSRPAGSSVLRRCVSYLAGGPINQPTASFAFYGSNDGAYTQVRDVLFANCYEIDSPALFRGDPNGTKWGSWYHPKSVRNVLHHGCGIINAGAYYGGFRTDNFGGPSADMAEYRDCFVAGLTNGDSPAAFSMSSGNGINDGAYVTVVDAPGGVQSGGVSLTNVLTTNVVHPVTRVGSEGAEQLYAVGTFLSKFGDSGFTTPQPDMPLWPFPYESYIKREFGVTLPKPGGFYPSAATETLDPFAGTSIGGEEMTFTRRVWEAAGQATPDFRTIY